MNTLHRKMKLNQYILNGAAIIDPLYLQNMPLTLTTLLPQQAVFGWTRIHKNLFKQNVYEGLTFSHVKFYYNLSAKFENLPRKPQNFDDNWLLASNSQAYKCMKESHLSQVSY